jgi:type IV pilus assembly protein PilQ
VYRARLADEGRKLIVEIDNADVVGAPTSITTPTGVVGGILTQAFRTPAGLVTRLHISLNRAVTYAFRTDGTTLRLLFAPTTGKTRVADGGVRPTQVAPPLRLVDVKFERASHGGKDKVADRGGCPPGACDRIVVATDGTPAYSVTTTKRGALRLVLRGVRVPDALARTLDVAAYGGPLTAVSTFYDAASESCIVEVERRGDARGIISGDGKELVWSFEGGAGNSNDTPAPVAAKEDGKKAPPRKSTVVAKEPEQPPVPRATTRYSDGDGIRVETSETSRAAATAHVHGQVAGQNGRYVGRRIDLDLKDADIHNILRLLADVGKVNIVTADDVKGEVTIRMRNVPWDQALDVVLQAKGLGMVQQGNLIRVAPMATLQKERELKLAQAKQEYELTPLETRLIPVSYAQAEDLAGRSRELLSPRGSIAVDNRTNVLIARDIAPNLNYIEQLVRSLDTQTPQVLVEARIVEATSRYLRDVGIQWGGDVTFSEATGNATGLAFPSRFSMAGGASDGQTPTAGVSPFQRIVPNPNFAVNLPAAAGTGQGGALGMQFGSVNNNFNLAVRLSAAEASGMVRIVSSPRILTLDNNEARIKQGTLIPFSQVSAQGVQTTFQEASLQLLVRPHVTADGSISMKVKINRNEPDFNQTSARGDPTILQREAEANLLVMDGHTAVIGGIYSRNTGRNLDQVPFFGDIPILGVLFQRRRASDLRAELLIFITPRIVNRAEALGR